MNKVFSVTDSDGASNPVVLVHGPAKATTAYSQGPIGHLAFESTQSIGVHPLTRSDWVQVLYRSNHQGVVQFKAERVFTSEILALAFASQHALSVQAKPVLKISNGTTSLFFSGAISECKAEPVGIAVIVSYGFTYGKVATSI